MKQIRKTQNYELPGYYNIHQIRINRKENGVSIYIKKVLNFKIKESLCISLLLENKRNTLINV